MKWFRSNIRHGARFALFALAVQIALSFGHFHGVAAQGAPAIHTAQQQLPASNPDPDQSPSEPCAICAVIALANTMLFAMPPVLPVPQAGELLYLSTGTAFAHLNSVSAAFQPRAPPLSS
jgi:hypothetical protein